MGSRIDRYRQRAATCAATDYGSPASVRRHNTAADEMRRLTTEPGAVEELLPLLGEPESGRWLAFQLLGLGQLPAADADRCLSIIRALAEGGGLDALGARMWLQAYEGPRA